MVEILVDICSYGKIKKLYAKRDEKLIILKDRGDGSYLVKAKENIIVFKHQIKLL
jgi:hypothetical protein